MPTTIRIAGHHIASSGPMRGIQPKLASRKSTPTTIRMTAPMVDWVASVKSSQCCCWRWRQVQRISPRARPMAASKPSTGCTRQPAQPHATGQQAGNQLSVLVSQRLDQLRRGAHLFVQFSRPRLDCRQPQLHFGDRRLLRRHIGVLGGRARLRQRAFSCPHCSRVFLRRQPLSGRC